MTMSGQMLFFVIKVTLSGLLIAFVSTLAKHFPRWAALLTALPLITLLSMIWIYIENRDLSQLESYAKDVLIWTLPSLFFFAAAIGLFRTRLPFFVSLALSTLALGLGVLLFSKLKILK
jgi:hypothetical protein